MAGILYEESSVWTFLFITVLLGGAAAWMTGRSAALEWRHYPVLVVQLLLLGVAVRFIHHALFDGDMFSAQYYLVDTLVDAEDDPVLVGLERLEGVELRAQQRGRSIPRPRHRCCAATEEAFPSALPPLVPAPTTGRAGSGRIGPSRSQGLDDLG